MFADFEDGSLTQNIGSYPIDFIPHAKIPCVGGHPKNIILLQELFMSSTRLKTEPKQAMYHFISGYTAKVAELQGVTEPTATFSACSGGVPRMAPQMRTDAAEKMDQHAADAWLINTGGSVLGPVSGSPLIYPPSSTPFMGVISNRWR